MSKIDEIDRKILTRLKIDGRSSVTTLAGILGLARGTVQSHLTRLIDSRTIKRFTIELNEIDVEEMVRAVMMIEVRGNTANSVQKALQRMPEVTSLHRTCGVWDLVIELETTSLYNFDGVLARIRELPGVSNSETCPLLRRIG
ncbi:MAG: Lrp/AsnC family transcriptional regulator, partial [Planktomarina sp.]|nr:Lrp/AsnC family transcriptional regulator [Planktomarina sp.]MDS9946136.1 Lrp/AsnC family transcriptional regulator [Planktomarina sp.]|tara:strand:- start:764 stop:1192 length:429 start_codon:yes stop_codon:yes gene_type:complete